MLTSNDALLTKVYAEQLGYFKDPFCAPFLQQKRKMFPIINRGTWARVYSIRQVIRRFLDQFPYSNIVSLGAGYDSTFFWLKSQKLTTDVTYVEIDFLDVVTKKIKTIKTHPLLRDLVSDQETSLAADDSINSKDYKLIAGDVRDTQLLVQILSCVDVSKPTLILTECLLIYMKSEDSEKLLHTISGLFPHIALLNYEMINPDDQFGRVMIENLEERGCSL